MTQPTAMEFDDQTQANRETLPARVRDQLRADLPRCLAAQPQEPSSGILVTLMKVWYHQQTTLFVQMLHEVAATTEQDRFFGSTITSREGTAEVRTRHLRPWDELPIGDHHSMVCGWRGVIGFFLEGEDLNWFDALLVSHDDLVSALH